MPGPRQAARKAQSVSFLRKIRVSRLWDGLWKGSCRESENPDKERMDADAQAGLGSDAGRFHAG